MFSSRDGLGNALFFNRADMRQATRLFPMPTDAVCSRRISCSLSRRVYVANSHRFPLLCRPISVRQRLEKAAVVFKSKQPMSALTRAIRHHWDTPSNAVCFSPFMFYQYLYLITLQTSGDINSHSQRFLWSGMKNHLPPSKWSRC